MIGCEGPGSAGQAEEAAAYVRASRMLRSSPQPHLPRRSRVSD